jgi:hypothetical protein
MVSGLQHLAVLNESRMASGEAREMVILLKPAFGLSLLYSHLEIFFLFSRKMQCGSRRRNGRSYGPSGRE